MDKYLKNRRVVAIVVAVAIVLAGLIFGSNLLSSQRKELELQKARRAEMETLKEEYLRISGKVRMMEQKKSTSGAQGVVQAVDEILAPLGLRGKVKSVKPGIRRETREGLAEEAEVLVEKLTMNEVINIFYRIDTMPLVVSVRKAGIKKSFENSQLLNVAMTVSFLKPK